MKEKVDMFRENMPILHTLFNPGMRDRHWALISEIVGYEISPSEETTLSSIIDMDLKALVGQFEPVAEAASKEFVLEKNLKKMKAEWASVSSGFEFKNWNGLNY